MKSKKKEELKDDKLMSENELRLISANKERKDLFQKYYKEKKKEAESKLLSTSMM